MIMEKNTIGNTLMLSFRLFCRKMVPMQRKRASVTFLMVLIVLIPLCAAGSQSARTSLPKNATEAGILPVDSSIGQTAEPDSDEAHAILYAALREEYSFDWTETHLAEPVRAALVRLFDQWLSTHLPCGEILMSVSRSSADGSTAITVRTGDSCMSFVLSGGLIVSMRETGL